MSSDPSSGNAAALPTHRKDAHTAEPTVAELDFTSTAMPFGARSAAESPAFGRRRSVLVFVSVVWYAVVAMREKHPCNDNEEAKYCAPDRWGYDEVCFRVLLLVEGQTSQRERFSDNGHDNDQWNDALEPTVADHAADLARRSQA